VTELVGWLSSVVLILTIARQVHKQWQAGSSEGVSRWLFAGQLTASIGFTVYSVLIHSWVFVVTNSLMVVNGLLGYWITARQKKRANDDAASPAQA
jgi:hypothetical protein